MILHQYCNLKLINEKVTVVGNQCDSINHANTINEQEFEQFANEHLIKDCLIYNHAKKKFILII